MPTVEPTRLGDNDFDEVVDFDALTDYQRYKLMASLVVPRPIALITTVGAGGVVNAAPFSMFAMVGEDPPLLMVSINRLKDAKRKDTAANIEATGEFVVHIADEPIAEQMHRCGAELPPWRSELDLVGLTTIDDTVVAPPRIAEAPVAFECRLYRQLDLESRHVYFGRIIRLHSRHGLVDRTTWRVRLQEYWPVGRFGASYYLTSQDRFTLSGQRSGEIDEM